MPGQQEGWRGTRSWDGTDPGHLTQSGQWGIPYRVTSCPVYKLGGVGMGDRCLGTNRVSISRWWAIALCITCIFQSVYYYCCHFISVIIIIISFFFSVLLNCSYLNPGVLLLFLIFSPIPLDGGEWVSGCVVLSCWLGLNHDSMKSILLTKSYFC